MLRDVGGAVIGTRRLAWLLYVSAFAAQTGWGALVPLLPVYSGRFHLSGIDAGMLMAASSLTTLLVSIPAGALSLRIGARRATQASLALMVIADLGQAAADRFWLLLVARCVFGLAFGILWTAGISWAGELAETGSPRAMALTVTASGTGSVFGPSAAGFLAVHFGPAGPFLCSAAITLVPAIGLLLAGRGRPEPAVSPERPALVSSLVRSTRNRYAHAALLLILIAGFSSSIANLVVPLELHRDGMGPEAIGLAFAVASLAFITASAGVARLGERGVRIGAGAGVCLLAACVLVPAVASTQTLPLLAFLVLRAPVGAAMYSIGYPLGVAGARAGTGGRDAVATLLNLGFAAAALVGPLAAGVLLEASGPQASFAALLAGCVVVAMRLNRTRTAVTA